MILFLFCTGGTNRTLVNRDFFDNLSKNLFSWSAGQFIFKLPDSLLLINELIFQRPDFTFKSIHLRSVDSTWSIGASSINIAATSICSSLLSTRNVFYSWDLSSSLYFRCPIYQWSHQLCLIYQSTFQYCDWHHPILVQGLLPHH